MGIFVLSRVLAFTVASTAFAWSGARHGGGSVGKTDTTEGRRPLMTERETAAQSKFCGEEFINKINRRLKDEVVSPNIIGGPPGKTAPPPIIGGPPGKTSPPPIIGGPPGKTEPVVSIKRDSLQRPLYVEIAHDGVKGVYQLKRGLSGDWYLSGLGLELKSLQNRLSDNVCSSLR